MQLIELLRKKELLPCVVFCFSKKRCDLLADNLQSLDLTSASEKSEIHVFCEKSLARLKGSDRELPQVLRVREMLKRGLGVHHAGLLPIVKEIVEMLFCRGVIKVLFSTETFAMGVNAPARTVIFQSLRKHDGKAFRNLLPGEYTQMAGRAGRRGLDSVGTVIIACWDDQLPEETEVRRMLTGAATKLESQFRLTYSMILNLLRVEDLKVEDMLRRSFAEFHAQRAQPEQAAALARGELALSRLRARPWPASPLATSRAAVEEYDSWTAQIEALDARLQQQVMATRGAQQALTGGRVVIVRDAATGVGELGVICEDEGGSSSGSGGGGGGARRPAQRGLGALAAAPAAAEDAAAGSSGRTHTVLSLHRPSPLDSQAPAPAAAAAVAAGGGPETRAASSSSMRNGLGGQQQQQQQAGALPSLPHLDGFGGQEPLRVLKKRDDDDDLMLGMRVGGKRGGGGGGLGARQRGGFTAQALALPAAGEVGGQAYRIREVPSSDITDICKVKIKVDGEAILRASNAAATAAAVNALVRVRDDAGNGTDPPTLDPVADLKLNSFELVRDMRERARLAALRAAHPAHRDPLLPEMLAMVRSERLLEERLAAITRQMSDANLQQMPEFHQRVAVLQRLGYLEADKTVTMKGRVACEVNSGDELVATELIFGGVLTELEPEEAVALLSALVFQEKTEGEPELPPRLQQAREDAVALAYQAGIVQAECGLQITPEEFILNTLKFGLMEVVYEWARGTPFQQICGLTDVMEGSIVRAIVRLDETCREFRDAARVMGNTALFQQMDRASQLIKRDVIFAASLYVA